MPMSRPQARAVIMMSRLVVRTWPCICILALIIALSLLAAGPAYARGPCEDGVCDMAHDVTIDGAGRIVVAGACQERDEETGWPVFYHALWRLNQDGTPDPTFGDGGVVVGPASGRAYVVVITADGSLVVPYVASGELAVMRYGPDGEPIGPVPAGASLDGHATEDIIGSMSLSGVIDSAGGVVVADAGSGGMGYLGSRPVIRRFLANGAEDTVFAASVTAARGAAPATPTLAAGRALTIDDAGRIVVTGSLTIDGVEQGVTLWRFNPDGTLDTTFGEGGMVTRNDAVTDRADTATAVATDDAGRVLVTGAIYRPVTINEHTINVNVMTIWCFAPDGEPDKSFGENGRVVWRQDPPHTSGGGIRIDAESRIVVSGTVSSRGSAVWRYLPDGTPDDSFGEDGYVGSEQHESQIFRSGYEMTIDSFGRIVVAGALGAGAFDVIVWRLNPDGSLDRSFGTEGFVYYDRATGFRGGEWVTQ
jgi:uncharacterized delta-60 repeat protein